MSGPPRHTQFGGGTRQKNICAPPIPSDCPPRPQARPVPPSLARLTTERGGLELFLQSPLDTHNPGGEHLETFSAHRSDPVSTHPGHQTGQPPPLARLAEEGGTPGEIFAPPPDTHNPGGGPLTKFTAAHVPMSAHPGHIYPPQDPPHWHASQKMGVPLTKTLPYP